MCKSKDPDEPFAKLWVNPPSVLASVMPLSGYTLVILAEKLDDVLSQKIRLFHGRKVSS